MADTNAPSYTRFSFDNEFFEVVSPNMPPMMRSVESVRQQGYEEGYTTGLKEGQTQAQADLARLQQHMQNTLAALQKTQTEREQQLLNQCLTLVHASLRRIIGHAAEHYGAEMLENHLRALLPLVKADETLTLRIHPSAQGYHEKLQLPQASIMGLPMQVVADGSLGPTDAVVEWRNGGVEGKLATHLAEVEKLLRGAGAAPLPEETHVNLNPPTPEETAAMREAQTATAPQAPQADEQPEQSPETPQQAGDADDTPITQAEKAARSRAAELLGDDELVDALKDR